MPHFEEIWPSGKTKDKYKRGHIPMDYYTDAMENGPKLSGMSICKVTCENFKKS